MTFYPLEKLHNLREGYRQVFQVEQLNLLLIEYNGKRLLFDNACPHAAHPLSSGTIENDVIRCPLHGIAFSLKTGQAENVENFSAKQCIRFYSFAYRDNVIGVEL